MLKKKYNENFGNSTYWEISILYFMLQVATNNKISIKFNKISI